MSLGKESSLESRLWRSNAREFGVQAVALFAAAGTFRYGQAWTYMAARLVPVVATNLYLIRRDRELLRRRLKIEEEGESEGVHKAFFAFLRLLGLAMFVVAGLDRRFQWSSVPLSVVVSATLAVTCGGFVIFRVFRENSHCSSVIEVGAQQQVVMTGPYRLVRHPMYTGALLAVVASPLALGSWYAALIVPPFCAILVMRILAEERFLSAGLPGYAAYIGITRKRLLPGVW
jgi:protein-S-isoprenylcysteine O-methyltransferase Ste14